MQRDDPSVVVFGTAEQHLSRDVPVVAPDATADAIRQSLAGRRFACATDIAVCADGRLLGLLTIEALLAAPASATADTLMDADPPVVRPGTDQEAAAWKAVHHGERALPVVDAAGRFLGLVPPERLLSVLLEEHQEDMARLAGVRKESLAATTALQEPLQQRVMHRLPWLLFGLAGVLVAADIVAAFERRLTAHVILAFFLPGVVYLADAVGTQTETLVVRGLSVGVPIGRTVGREVLTGLLVGGALALASIPAALWRWGSGDIVPILAASLLATCSVATLVGVALPCLLHRLGMDPAFGSGPLGTVIQDLLSISIYLGMASLYLS